MFPQVLVPGNFKEHKMVTSTDETFINAGFRIGDYVCLKKRITVKHGFGACDRKDVPAGSKLAIKGFVGTEIVCEIEIPCGAKGKLKTIDWKVAKNNVILASAVEADAEPKAKCARKYAFLETLDNEHVGGGDLEIFEEWEGSQLQKDEASDVNRAKNMVSFALDTIIASLPKYSQADLAVVKRDGEIEVWTMRDFKPGALKFAPETCEIKPRHWTAGRSAIAKNISVGAERRPLVLDGRVRAAPMGKSSFALFWVVQRAPSKDKGINMSLVYSTMTIKTKLAIDDVEISGDAGEEDNPSIPVLVNLKGVKKHTRLIAPEDADMKKLLEKETKEKSNADDKRKNETDGDAPAAKKAK